MQYITSHLQIRGSVPLFWEQTGIKAKTRITREFDLNNDGFLKHLRQFYFQFRLRDVYTRIISVNLMAVNKSDEKCITDEYEKLIKHNKLDFYKYVYFDFHKECHNQKFEKVNPLIKSLEE